VGEVQECRLTHDSWRRGDAPCQSDFDLVQLLVSLLNNFWLGPAAVGQNGLIRAKFFSHRGDRIFTPGLNHFAAVELVWIGIPDQLSEPFEMFVASPSRSVA